jgi:hypothetical protein
MEEELEDVDVDDIDVAVVLLLLFACVVMFRIDSFVKLSSRSSRPITRDISSNATPVQN